MKANTSTSSNSSLTGVRRRQDRPRPVVNSEPEADAQFLDESEQDQLVAELRAESAKQQAWIESGLIAVCRIVALMTVGWGILLELTQSHNAPSSRPTNVHLSPLDWIHIGISCILYWHTPCWIGGICDSGDEKQSSRSIDYASAEAGFRQQCMVWTVIYGLSVFIAAVGLLQARRQDHDMDTRSKVLLHYGLLIGNMVVMGLAYLVRHEERRTETLLNDVAASRYRFKTL
jgi:hypothetical protein